jgi:hypothetical protein
VPEDQYKSWLKSARTSTDQLDTGRYAQLAAPSRSDEPVIFGRVTEGLFDIIVRNHGALLAPIKATANANTRPL